MLDRPPCLAYIKEMHRFWIINEEQNLRRQKISLAPFKNNLIPDSGVLYVNQGLQAISFKQHQAI